jgi:rhamnopyranosyl-N-acetylglucosaminyl-diphospho-decaprenol beta-1,3/1,4-galactofuranosyltransferase
MKNIQILAVVVTHNRRMLLSRCLDNLLAQTRQPDQILVVNNASSDGTAEMLEQRGIPFITQENLGSAGGWHRGIQHAMDNRFDAVWLMDDDGFPDVDALGVLEASLLPDIACAASIVVREDIPTDFVFDLPVLNMSDLPVIWGRTRKLGTMSELRVAAPGGTYPFAHFFNGALISMTAVREVGNVDCNFFMSGDELDYQYRLRKAGKVISVLDAIHYHPDQSQRPYTPAKVYYFVKNSLVLNTRYFNAVWIRHALTIAVVIVRTASRNSIFGALSLLLGANAPMFYLAIIRGLRGKLGKDFNE